ncbi:MAG: recombinase RecA [Patescibacteria group bacterium]
MATKKTSTANTGENNKSKVLEGILKQINNTFGEGTIMKMDEVAAIPVEVVPTGILSLDLAIGVGGLPRGRIIEIYGPEAGGKTTLALSVISQAQKLGGTAAFIDAEHALDPERAAQLGVNLSEMFISQPDYGEQALEIVDSLVRSNAFDVIVIDSVAALTPKSEIEGNMGDAQMALQARLMSQALRKITGAINKSKCVVIFINQVRMKLGVMFGNPETTTGGNALKFFSSIRLDVRKIGQLKEGADIIGTRHQVKVVKNKVAAPFRKAEFDLIFNEPGVISIGGQVLEVGQAIGLINRSGNTYLYTDASGNEVKIGVGNKAARSELLKNSDLMNEIESRIKSSIKEGNAEFLKTTPSEEDEEGEEPEV